MRRFNLVFLLLIAVLLVSCSKDEGVTSPSTDSFITGTWRMEFTVNTSSRTDAVKLSAVLSGKDASFTGTGDLTYSGLVGTTNFSYTIKDNATGTYSSNDIKLTIISTISGNKYEFVGTRDNSASATTYRGTATLTINGTATVFTNNTLFKSAS